MTVQIVREDGNIELVEDVNRIEVNKESGKRNVGTIYQIFYVSFSNRKGY